MLAGFGRHILLAALTAVAVAALSTPAFAQSGKILGKVTDEQGRPVADATVEVSIRGTRLTAKTSESGDDSAFLVDTAYLHEKLASPAVQAAVQELRESRVECSSIPVASSSSAPRAFSGRRSSLRQAIPTRAFDSDVRSANSMMAAAGAGSAQAPSFSSKVESVRVDVLVIENGKPVLGLRPVDFDVRDNGVPQQADLASYEEIPLTVILALDMSASLDAKALEHLRLKEIKRAGRSS